MSPCTKELLSILLVSIIAFPGNIFAQTKSPVDTSPIGQKVKVILTNGNEVVGTIRVWDIKSVVLETDVGEVKIEPKNIARAVSVKDEISPESRMDDSNFNHTFEQEWRKQVTSVKGTRDFLWVSGGLTFVGGIVLAIMGQLQARNAAFKRKGNIITNEDDVNEGNQKSLVGGLLASGGVALGVWGVFKNDELHQLEQEGKKKGFRIGFKTDETLSEISLAYVYRF